MILLMAEIPFPTTKDDDYPIIYRVSAPSQVVGPWDFRDPSTVGIGINGLRLGSCACQISCTALGVGSG